ncbi:MAG: hypothetical protein LBS21_11100 [Clostridiales bacterium]|nr:hypothetical protein [Clostridiales bacterium]
MFKYEYDEELAKEAARLDGYEEGREDGIEKGREEYVKDLIMRMLRKGKSIESIVSDTDIPMYKVIGIKELMAAEA